MSRAHGLTLVPSGCGSVPMRRAGSWADVPWCSTPVLRHPNSWIDATRAQRGWRGWIGTTRPPSLTIYSQPLSPLGFKALISCLLSSRGWLPLFQASLSFSTIPLARSPSITLPLPRPWLQRVAFRRPPMSGGGRRRKPREPQPIAFPGAWSRRSASPSWPTRASFEKPLSGEP